MHDVVNRHDFRSSMKSMQNTNPSQEKVSSVYTMEKSPPKRRFWVYIQWTRALPREGFECIYNGQEPSQEKVLSVYTMDKSPPKRRFRVYIQWKRGQGRSWGGCVHIAHTPPEDLPRGASAATLSNFWLGVLGFRFSVNYLATCPGYADICRTANQYYLLWLLLFSIVPGVLWVEIAARKMMEIALHDRALCWSLCTRRVSLWVYKHISAQNDFKQLVSNSLSPCNVWGVGVRRLQSWWCEESREQSQGVPHRHALLSRILKWPTLHHFQKLCFRKPILPKN